MTSTIVKFATFVLALGVSSALYANEQYGTSQTEQPTQTFQPAASTLKDSNLEKFAAVQKDLESIREEYSAKLGSVSDPSKATELQQEASQSMIEAVENTGLDVETYSQIAQALGNDPELRERVMAMMN